MIAGRLGLNLAVIVSYAAVAIVCPVRGSEDPEALRRAAEQAERDRAERAQTSGDATEIRDIFAEYRDALTRLDGDAAVEVVDDATVAMYADYLDHARSADRAVLATLPPLDLLTVLRIRVEFRAERLSEMDGRELLAETIARGWTGEVADLRLGSIEVDAGRGLATATVAGADAGPAFFFRRVEGPSAAPQWKVDLVRLVEHARPSYEALYAKEGDGQSITQWALQWTSVLTGLHADESVLSPPDAVADEGPAG